MRTTLDIDDDVLQAAKEIAANRRTTMGHVISELVRKGLAPSELLKVRNGVPLMPWKPEEGPLLTIAEVNRIRDED